MDYKKSKAPVNTVTRNIMDLCADTGNIYEKGCCCWLLWRKDGAGGWPNVY